MNPPSEKDAMDELKISARDVIVAPSREVEIDENQKYMILPLDMPRPMRSMWGPKILERAAMDWVPAPPSLAALIHRNDGDDPSL